MTQIEAKPRLPLLARASRLHWWTRIFLRALRQLSLYRKMFGQLGVHALRKSIPEVATEQFAGPDEDPTLIDKISL